MRWTSLPPDLPLTAGLVSSADRAGALCGALVLGTLFIPLIGITLSCAWVGMLQCSRVRVLLLTGK